MDNQSQTAKQDMALGSGKSCCTDTALAPSCGTDTNYSCTCGTCVCLDSVEERVAEPNLLSLNLQLLFFTNKADDLQKHLSEVVSDREVCAASVVSFLFTCQPFFNFLESTARGTLNESNLSEATRSELFDFSQTLCNKLEILVLTCASKGLLSVDETEPRSVSHFHIGQCWFGPLRVTLFRYCQPTPYLAEVNTGLHKRMRWNVDRLGEIGADNTEYYFLCCEAAAPPPEGDSVSHGSLVTTWSICQWNQVSPETDDINDWILCKVPQGTCVKLVILGNDEPPVWKATDCLLQLLMSDQK